MVTIRKRGSRYNAQIRKEGYPFYDQDLYQHLNSQEVGQQY